jgi:hypothetical protein
MRRASRTQIVLALLLAASLIFLLASLRGNPPPRSAARAARPAAGGPAAAQAGQQLSPAAPADVDFRRYASLAGSNIFSETRARPAPPPGERKPVPPPVWPRGETTQQSAPPRPDFSGWTYVGYASLDGEKLGALQNDATNAVHFLAVGDTFLGAEVESLDREAMRLRSGGSTTTLSRPRDFPITPLTQAPGAAPQPGPEQRRGR